MCPSQLQAACMCAPGRPKRREQYAATSSRKKQLRNAGRLEWRVCMPRAAEAMAVVNMPSTPAGVKKKVRLRVRRKGTCVRQPGGADGGNRCKRFA